MQDSILYPPIVPTPMPRRSMGETFMDSLENALSMVLNAIPRIFGFILIVAIGWFLAGLLAKGVMTLLRAIRFDEIVQRSGIGNFMNRLGTGMDPAGVVAGIVKWIVRVVVLLVAFDTLGLPAVSDVLRQLLLWLPNLIVALVLLFIAGVLANALAGVVRAATSDAGFTNPDLLANVARTAVWAFGIVVAVNQLGIAQALINTLFMGFVGAIALATGLAFGLGGRDRAARAIDNWQQQAREAKPKAERAGRAAVDGPSLDEGAE
ncbi:MAG: small-conductance mechanosensitive ion channel [Gemmatimonadaceae bacterium]|nr:small-conductance mechanosensitive ion channel [Gemmatimonadaceae bacterium]MDQ3243427.1 small-conductance mechanosensitive ion channel [Gemmatimonadota bacterium]